LPQAAEALLKRSEVADRNGAGNGAFESAANEGCHAGGNAFDGAPGPRKGSCLCLGNSAHSHPHLK